jgi:hypothetical protein
MEVVFVSLHTAAWVTAPPRLPLHFCSQTWRKTIFQTEQIMSIARQLTINCITKNWRNILKIVKIVAGTSGLVFPYTAIKATKALFRLSN